MASIIAQTKKQIQQMVNWFLFEVEPPAKWLRTPSCVKLGATEVMNVVLHENRITWNVNETLFIGVS